MLQLKKNSLNSLISKNNKKLKELLDLHLYNKKDNKDSPIKKFLKSKIVLSKITK